MNKPRYLAATIVTPNLGRALAGTTAPPAKTLTKARAYRTAVIGMIEAATMFGQEPMDEVLKEAVQFAKLHGGVALLEMENQAIPNPKGSMLFHHQWYAIRFATAAAAASPTTTR